MNDETILASLLHVLFSMTCWEREHPIFESLSVAFSVMIDESLSYYEYVVSV